MGKWLRNRYSNFLSQNYTTKEIYIVSDDMDRCLMSASSNLAGLYPPQGVQIWNPDLLWQPVPVHVDGGLLGGAPYTCPRYDWLVAQLALSDEINKYNEENKELLEFVGNSTGELIVSFLQLSGINDILYIESTRNLTLPSWTQGIYPGIIQDLSAVTFSLSTWTKELSKFSTGLLLNEFVEKLSDPSKKIYMYSAHDTNVANLLFTLEPTMKRFCPEFATTVIVELWRIDGEDVFKFFYRRVDELIPINVENCGQQCSVGVFKEAFKDVIVSKEKWELDCFGI